MFEYLRSMTHWVGELIYLASKWLNVIGYTVGYAINDLAYRKRKTTR